MPGPINAGILGIGVHVPDKILTNEDLENMVDTSDEWIKSRSGIQQRHIAAPEECTSDFAVEAAKKALANAHLSPENIDLIIVSTNTPDMLFPATACLVQNKLGASKAGAFDLLAGCSGFVYGLSVATQYIVSGTYRHVLVIGAETLSRIINWQDRNTCVLFGDGAGAIVMGPVSPPKGVLSTRLGADGSGGPLLCLPAGGARMPASHKTVEEQLHYVSMNGREVFKFAVKTMGEGALQALAAAGLKKEDIDFFIPHQANIRIIESAAKRLGLSMDQVQVNVDQYGNTSTASIPLALYDAVKSGKIKEGDCLVLISFGAGLTWAAAVVRWGI